MLGAKRQPVRQIMAVVAQGVRAVATEQPGRDQGRSRSSAMSSRDELSAVLTSVLVDGSPRVTEQTKGGLSCVARVTSWLARRALIDVYRLVRRTR